MPNILWYKNPAKNWNEALPLGNGLLGAMVFGDARREKISLNEDSIWSGNFTDRNNPDALKYLPEIRQLLLDGEIQKAEDLSLLALSGLPEGQRIYQMLGNLTLNFGRFEPTDYKRSLDISTGVAAVTYKQNGVDVKREYFINAPQNVGVIRISADKSIINCVVKLERSHQINKIGIENECIILQSGAGIEFTAGVNVISANKKCIGEEIIIENSSEIIIYYACRTSFRTPIHEKECINLLKNAQNLGYTKLFDEHIADFSKYFNRMEINLGEEIDIPTDERLEKVKNGETDNDLVGKMFQFGRYLLISCSRPGSLPATLQGIWNDSMLPPWDSKYTININTEMNYWHAESTNLSEMHMPLFDHLKRMMPNGQHTAKYMYNCRGMMTHHNTDIWGDTAPQDRYVPASFWVLGSAWLSTHIWEHYLFTQDKEFLINNYETLKQSALFFVDFLTEDKNGYLAANPSVSPENTYILPNGNSGRLSVGSSMDNQILRLLFEAVIKSSEILDADHEFAAEITTIRDRLAPNQIGKHGQIMEWNADYDEAEPGHRHISHLFALFPSNEISPLHTPKLADGAIVTLDRRLSSGGGHTGWSRAWIINMYARLLDGDKALENAVALLQKSTLPNLLDNHPPFQIDGNFGFSSGIAEMLVQSQNNEIHLLAAMPNAWKKGHVKGLKVRGNVEVDIYWNENKLIKAVFRANITQKIKIRAEKGLSFDVPFEFDNGLYILDMVKDSEYTLNRG